MLSRRIFAIAAIAVLVLALCAAQRPEQSAIRSTVSAQRETTQGATSAIEPRTSPNPPRPVHHAFGGTTRFAPASPAPAPIQHTRAPSPPIHSGGLHGLVCSYGWSCTIASCIINRESRWFTRAFNPRSRAAGWWQWLPMWYRGRFDPFNPYVATAVAWDHYKRWGWRDWSGDGPACGF